MPIQEIYFLNSGSLTVDQGSMTSRRHVGVKTKIPVSATLLKSDDKYILFDTGLNVDGLGDPDGIWGVKKHVVADFDKTHNIIQQLADLSIHPDDIDIVINSHLHWDHCGNNKAFKNAIFYVQKSEYRFAMYPDTFEADLYIQNHFNHPLHYELLEGDDIIDGDIQILSTPGHTVGHQSLLVHHEKHGKLLLAGDTFYCLEAFNKLIPPGIINNAAEVNLSMKRLKMLVEKEDAKIIMMHEPEFWDVYKGLEG